MAQYYAILQNNPCIPLRFLQELITRTVGGETGLVGKFTLGGYEFEVSFSSEKMLLTLKWEPEKGEERIQRIRILSEESNLHNGSSVYYFRCPVKGVKCRKLFYIGGCFMSRRAFYHKYPTQQRSHRDRIIMQRPEPYRRGGKRYYRGKLTPYGRRCEKYEEWEEARELELYEWSMKYINWENLLQWD